MRRRASTRLDLLLRATPRRRCDPPRTGAPCASSGASKVSVTVPRSVSRRTVTARRAASTPRLSERCPPVLGVRSRIRSPVAATCRFAAESFGMLCAMAISSTHASSDARPRTATIADIAALAGVSVPTVSKVINGRSDVVAGDAPTGRGGDPRARLSAAGAHRPAGAAARGHLPRARERVGARDRPRRRAGRRPAPPRGRAVRDAGPADARAAAGSRASSPAGRPGVIAVFSDLSEAMRTQLRTRGIPFVVVDPTGEPLHDTPSIGATNWNGGLTATRHLLGLGPPADRRHRRAGRDPLQPGAARRLSRGDGRGRRPDRPAADQPRPVPRRGGDRAGPRAASRWRTARPRSSPATTSRRSASTRPRARRGSTSRRTSASSASTTCRSRSGSARR